jgi:hypothetical protein
MDFNYVGFVIVLLFAAGIALGSIGLLRLLRIRNVILQSMLGMSIAVFLGGFLKGARMDGREAAEIAVLGMVLGLILGVFLRTIQWLRKRQEMGRDS